MSEQNAEQGHSDERMRACRSSCQKASGSTTSSASPDGAPSADATPMPQVQAAGNPGTGSTRRPTSTPAPPESGASAITSEEPGCSCGGIAACAQCQQRDAALIAAREIGPTCIHGWRESQCPTCAACAACGGRCGTCPYLRAAAPLTCWRSECRNGCYYPGACSEASVLHRTAPEVCHNGHPFVPGVSVDHAPGESDPRWCNTCGEHRNPPAHPTPGGTP